MTVLLAAWMLTVTTLPSPSQTDIEERLGEWIPLDVAFTNQNGDVASLSHHISGKRPIVLSLVYYRCPMLCSLVLSGLTRSIRAAQLSLGEEFDAVTISIDPTETVEEALRKRRGHLQVIRAAELEAWPFLIGTEESISALARSVGFKYRYDEQTKQFAHSAVVFILSPEGKITRYLYGMDFAPRDLRWSLVEASQGRVGTTLDRVLLTCFQYDPARRKYGFTVMGFLRIGALLVFGTVAGVLIHFWRKEMRTAR